MSWFDQPIPSRRIRRGVGDFLDSPIPEARRGIADAINEADTGTTRQLQAWIQQLLNAVGAGGGVSLSGPDGGMGGVGAPAATGQPALSAPGPAMAQAAPESLLAGPPAPPGMAGTPPVGPPPAGMLGAAPDSLTPSPGGGNPLEALMQAAGGLFGGGSNDLGLRDAFAKAPGSYERATAYTGSTPEEQRASGLGKPRNPLNDPVGGGDFYKPLPGGTSSLLDPTTASVPGAPLSNTVARSTSLVPAGGSSPARVAGGGLTGAGLGGSSLADALSGRIGSESILAEYMADPQFAVTDILADAGMNPDRNRYSEYVANKWGPVLGDFAQLSSMLSPDYVAGGGGEGQGGRDWANFVSQWAGGGGDPLSVLRAAVQAANTDTEQGKAFQDVLGDLKPARLAAMISTARGEAGMAAQARARMAERGALAARRAAQDRAAAGTMNAAGEMDPDTKEWLRYMLGAVGG